VFHLLLVIQEASIMPPHFGICSLDQLTGGKAIDKHEGSKLFSVSVSAEELLVKSKVRTQVKGKHFNISEVRVGRYLHHSAL
jgi:hypothetical protein